MKDKEERYKAWHQHFYYVTDNEALKMFIINKVFQQKTDKRRRVDRRHHFISGA